MVSFSRANDSWTVRITEGFACDFFYVTEYRVLRHLGEGTFSEVLKAESVKTRQKVAIKCMKSHFDRIEQVSCCFPIRPMDGHRFTAERLITRL